jgi:hypothetical protein
MDPEGGSSLESEASLSAALALFNITDNSFPT